MDTVHLFFLNICIPRLPRIKKPNIYINTDTNAVIEAYTQSYKSTLYKKK